MSSRKSTFPSKDNSCSINIKWWTCGTQE